VAYLIDTNIAIHARDGTEAVLQKFTKHVDAVLISALSLAELQRGLYKYPADSNIRRMRLELMLRHIPVLPFDAAAARAYGQIIAQCGWVKRRDYDRMIAAHAIATASVLVTDNMADFSDIPGLSLENWITKDAKL
jgi:tRNA(fMet)-specific endonuclease VapC